MYWSAGVQFCCVRRCGAGPTCLICCIPSCPACLPSPPAENEARAFAKSEGWETEDVEEIALRVGGCLGDCCLPAWLGVQSCAVLGRASDPAMQQSAGMHCSDMVRGALASILAPLRPTLIPPLPAPLPRPCCR